MSKSFLVIDDNEDSRDLHREILLLNGHTVHTVETAAEALDYLQGETKVDGVFTDLRIPGVDHQGGFVALLRSARPGIFVALISGDANLASIAKNVGVPFLVKPINMRNLLALAQEAGTP